MKIYGMNRCSKDGSGSNSDIIIHADSFCELSIFCDAVLQIYEGKDYGENSGVDRSVKIAKAINQMMHPMNANPARLFSI